MTTTQVPTLVLERAALMAVDRCDICQAAAMVEVTFLNGPLLFCGHHAKDKKELLTTKSATIFDPNNILNLLN